MNGLRAREALSERPATRRETTQLKELATRSLEVVDPDTTLEEAAEQMKAAGGGPLLVCEHDRLVGLLAFRDLTAWAAAEGGDPRIARVRDAMATDVPYCFDDQPAHDAARLMQQRRLPRLAVLDHDRRLVGVVELGDVASSY